MTLEELGAALREAREKAGMEGKEVAANLRIPTALVSAIEAGDLDMFPHYVYARGSIKAYAGMMRLPDEDVGSALADLAARSGQQFVAKPAAMPRRRLVGSGGSAIPDPRVISVVVCAVALLLGIVVLVAYREEIVSEVVSWWPTDRPPTEQGSTRVNILPDAAPDTISVEAGTEKSAKGRQAPSEPEAVEAPKPAASVVETEAVPPVSSGTASEPVSETSVVQVPESPAVPSVTPSAVSGASDATVQAGDAASVKVAESEKVVQREMPVVVSGQKEKAEQDPTARGPRHVIEVKCIEPSWLSFRPDKGKRRNLDMMPGDKFLYEFTGSVTVRLGNAGGVFIILDGVPQRHLGKSGDVKSVKFPR